MHYYSQSLGQALINVCYVHSTIQKPHRTFTVLHLGWSHCSMAPSPALQEYSTFACTTPVQETVSDRESVSVLQQTRISSVISKVSNMFKFIHLDYLSLSVDQLSYQLCIVFYQYMKTMDFCSNMGQQYLVQWCSGNF